MALQEGDLILGTVESVSNTVVFVILPDGRKATIVSSEIAPGRIKNMRQYVVPNKKIVCKVLRINGNNIDLSLRRVNTKEKKEVMQTHKREQTSKSAIHSILKDKATEVENKILADFPSLFEFLSQSKENERLIDKYFPKEFHDSIKKITQKKQKLVDVNYIIKLKCLEEDGIKRIKKVFSTDKERVSITYLSAGNFKLKILAKDYKEGNRVMQEILADLEKNAKTNVCEFSSEEFKQTK